MKQVSALTFISAVMMSISAQAGATVSVVDASVEDVAGCRHIGGIGGVYTWQNDDAAPVEAEAKRAARQDARSLGATHVVWTGGISSYGSHGMGEARFEGDAFVCPVQRA